jgi:hypothetical protein
MKMMRRRVIVRSKLVVVICFLDTHGFRRSLYLPPVWVCVVS